MKIKIEKIIRVNIWLALILCLTSSVIAQECVECHSQVTPNIVNDWKFSKHSQRDITCSSCHGTEHKSAEDIAKVKIPTPDTCALCHSVQVEQFKKSKHSFAWKAMKALPVFHWLPMALTEGQKGCGGCHKIGLKTEDEIKELKQKSTAFGLASCDSCHTRHVFSTEESRQPQACQTCHMGFDHPQWEMYSSSKHGVRYLLKQNKVLPEDTPAPTCFSCHFSAGHSGRMPWGFLAVRLPMPEDKEWAADRSVILQALGVLDPDGKPTERLELVKSVEMVRLTQEDWQKLRESMLDMCNRCHSSGFAKEQLERGDAMIREADRMMAEAIRAVASLYKDGILKKTLNYKHAFPDLLTANYAPTLIENKLFEMFFEYRMRTFQGVFHANPDYAFWYGFSNMQKALTEIKGMAEDLRAKKKTRKK